MALMLIARAKLELSSSAIRPVEKGLQKKYSEAMRWRRYVRDVMGSLIIGAFVGGAVGWGVIYPFARQPAIYLGLRFGSMAGGAIGAIFGVAKNGIFLNRKVLSRDPLEPEQVFHDL